MHTTIHSKTIAVIEAVRVDFISLFDVIKKWYILLQNLF